MQVSKLSKKRRKRQSDRPDRGTVKSFMKILVLIQRSKKRVILSRLELELCKGSAQTGYKGEEVQMSFQRTQADDLTNITSAMKAKTRENF